jgi:hypothetical protein
MATNVAKLSRDPETGDMLYEPEAQFPAPAVSTPAEQDFFANLATGMPEHRSSQIGNMVTEQITYDERSRDEWEEIAARNIQLLGIGPESKPDDFEYAASDTSDHPLLLTALTRFQSKALSAMLPGPDQVCRFEPAMDLELIEDEAEREVAQQDTDASGRRVMKFYADYLLKQHPSYVEDTDLILYDCGLQGAGVRKIYNDPTRPRRKTRIERARLQDLILAYDTESWTCGRITHRIDMPTPELIRCIQTGFYRPVDRLIDGDVPRLDRLTEEQNRIQGLSNDYMRGGEQHRIYETHMELFLDEDRHSKGFARPYIVSVHARTQEVLAIQRNWSPSDEEEQRIERFVAYLFHPGSNALHGLGLGHLLGNITKALRTGQRRALDAAYLANHPSGFKLSQWKIRDEGTPVKPGEFVDVEATVDDIRAALMLHPFEGPNQGLLALMEKMETNGRELGGIASIDFSQLMKAGIAAGPAMAAYEESVEFQTAIHRRLYDAQAQELRLIHARMREVVTGATNFGTNGVLQEGDLASVDIVPYMKPGQASRQRQILEAQAILDVATEAPDVVNKRKAVEDYLRALGKPDIDSYILPDPAETPPEPADPVTEYAAILAGTPVAAGQMQNHQAHIDAHAAQMRGLATSQLPIEQGQAAMAAIAAHIGEHMGMMLLVQLAAQTGIPVEQFGEAMTPEMETQVAPMVAQAVVAIEAERAATMAPADPNAARVEVEKTKQAGQQTLATMKQAHEAAMRELEHKQAMELQTAKDAAARELQEVKDTAARELQEAKDAAAMEREEADNETAIEIAEMKQQEPATDATARAGAAAGAIATTPRF